MQICIKTASNTRRPGAAATHGGPRTVVLYSCTVLYSYCTAVLYWHAAAMLLAGIMPGPPAAAAACSMHHACMARCMVHGSGWRLAAARQLAGEGETA
eukprot:COSAG02_NODE_1546_length_11977_cov_3.458586_15_plen_98_part_00